MILEDFYTRLAEKTARDSTNSTDQALMRRAFESAMKDINRRVSLPLLKFTTTFTSVSGTSTYRLDSRVRRPFSIRDTTNSLALETVSKQEFDRQYPDPDLTDTDIPGMVVPLRKDRVSADMTADSTVTVVSDSASDATSGSTSYNVVIRGTDSTSGTETSERVTLTGTSSVASTNTYSDVYSITKDETNGTVTCTQTTTAATLISMLPKEKEKEFWLVQLYKTPDDAYTYSYDYLREPWEVEYDEDVIPIDNVYTDLLIAKAAAYILQTQGDSGWQNETQLYEQKMQQVKDDNYDSEEHDWRFGFQDVDYEGNFS